MFRPREASPSKPRAVRPTRRVQIGHLVVRDSPPHARLGRVAGGVSPKYQRSEDEGTSIPRVAKALLYRSNSNRSRLQAGQLLLRDALLRPRSPARRRSLPCSGPDSVNALPVDQEASPGPNQRASHSRAQRQAAKAPDGYLSAVCENRDIVTGVFPSLQRASLPLPRCSTRVIRTATVPARSRSQPGCTTVRFLSAARFNVINRSGRHMDLDDGERVPAGQLPLRLCVGKGQVRPSHCTAGTTTTTPVAGSRTPTTTRATTTISSWVSSCDRCSDGQFGVPPGPIVSPGRHDRRELSIDRRPLQVAEVELNDTHGESKHKGWRSGPRHRCRRANRVRSWVTSAE
jgi:hypothetical protein